METAAYGIVNARTKWHFLSDSKLRELGLSPLAAIPQLFTKETEKGLVLQVAKLVDEVLLTDENAHIDKFTADFYEAYKLRTASYGPRQLIFFGLPIIQHQDCSSTIHGDEKLHSLEPYPLSRLHRRDEHKEMIKVKL